MVVRGWKAWKKRMNLRYWGIIWSLGPTGEMEMNLVMLRIVEDTMTGTMWHTVTLLCDCWWYFP